MMLDRQQLARYIGDDRAFEAQFLALLLDSIQGCVVALEAPSPQIYTVLHAAKAGITVAACEDLIALHQSACDRTINPSSVGAWSDDCLALLMRLREHLIHLTAEIEPVIATSPSSSAL